MRECIKIAFWQFKSWKGSVRVLIAVAASVIMTFYQSQKYIGYCKETDAIINCFETYITVSSNVVFLTVFFMIVLLLFADAPFMDNNSLYSVIRVGRNKWCIGKLIYIISASVFLNGIVMVTTIVASLAYSYPGNIWSDAYLSVLQGNAVMLGYDVNLSNYYIIQLFTPATAAFTSYGLSVLFTCMIALLIYVLNIAGNRVLGFSVVSILYFMGYTVGGSKISAFLPMENCMLETHLFNGAGIANGTIELKWSLVYFSGLIIMCCIMSLIIIRKVDFKITIGERI